MHNIYLVGFMGTGKTSVGKALAARTGMRFVDLDELIEFKEKRSIPQIFAEKGEPYFRRVEKQTLREVAREDGFVVACGGGVVMDQDNVDIMQRTGKAVCLSASPDVILQRTQGQSHRPLLNVGNPRERIEFLLKMRAPYYARIGEAIDTSCLSVAEVVSVVIRRLQGRAVKAKHDRIRGVDRVKPKRKHRGAKT